MAICRAWKFWGNYYYYYHLSSLPQQVFGRGAFTVWVTVEKQRHRLGLSIYTCNKVHWLSCLSAGLLNCRPRHSIYTDSALSLCTLLLNPFQEDWCVRIIMLSQLRGYFWQQCRCLAAVNKSWIWTLVIENGQNQTIIQTQKHIKHESIMNWSVYRVYVFFSLSDNRQEFFVSQMCIYIKLVSIPRFLSLCVKECWCQMSLGRWLKPKPDLLSFWSDWIPL